VFLSCESRPCCGHRSLSRVGKKTKRAASIAASARFWHKAEGRTDCSYIHSESSAGATGRHRPSMVSTPALSDHPIPPVAASALRERRSHRRAAWQAAAGSRRRVQPVGRRRRLRAGRWVGFPSPRSRARRSPAASLHAIGELQLREAHLLTGMTDALSDELRMHGRAAGTRHDRVSCAGALAGRREPELLGLRSAREVRASERRRASCVGFDGVDDVLGCLGRLSSDFIA
jgi:hypothetical protein